MHSANELLRELQRLNKTGVINDEEYLVLRKVIAGGNVGSEFYRRFEQLFAGHSKSAAIDTESEGRSAAKEKKPVKDERLYSLAEAVNELNLKLASLGGFDGARALFSCPACGMFEDLTAEGKLIVAEPIDPKIDTGLRFVRINDTEWECPDCGHLCAETIKNKN